MDPIYSPSSQVSAYADDQQLFDSRLYSPPSPTDSFRGMQTSEEFFLSMTPVTRMSSTFQSSLPEANLPVYTTHRSGSVRTAPLYECSNTSQVKPHLTLERLEADLRRLPTDVRNLALTILEGSRTLRRVPGDNLEGPRNVCWWKILWDDSQELFHECYLLCATQPEYLKLAPDDVQQMVAAIQTGDQETRDQAAKVTMAAAIAWQKAWDSEALKKWGGSDDPNLTGPDISRLKRPNSSSYRDQHRMANGPAHKRKWLQIEDDIPDLLRDGAPKDESDASVHAPKRIKVSRGTALTGVQPKTPASHQGDRPSLSKWKKKDGNLDPGVKKFRWPAARQRIYRELQGLNVPASALTGVVHEFESTSTPASVDPRVCNFVLSIEEILTWFAQHTHWREICWRIMKHWTASQVVAFISWTRNLSEAKSIKRDTLQKRFRKAREWAANPITVKEKHGNAKSAPSIKKNKASTAQDPEVKGNMSHMSNINGLTGRDKNLLADYYIWDLAEGVSVDRYPTGKGAQILTRVIKHVREVTHDHDVKLSGIAEYARGHRITVPESDRLGADTAAEDLAAKNRHGSISTDRYREQFGTML